MVILEFGLGSMNDIVSNLFWLIYQTIDFLNMGCMQQKKKAVQANLAPQESPIQLAEHNLHTPN